MEYRQRAGMLLEACLRVAISLQSYRLAKTIIEAVCMFKIGVVQPTSPDKIGWFNSVMTKQYGGPAGLPRLAISQQKISGDEGDEIATGDKISLIMEMDRPHAELFTRAKIAMCQKQGIPPQVGLQTYREGWWLLLRQVKLDDPGNTPKADLPDSPLVKLLKAEEIAKYDAETDLNRLVTAWPIVVQNISQKSGRVKIQLKAPSVPGKYKFVVAIKSQEFLGADQEFSLECNVVDASTVVRAPKEEDTKEDDEAKKDK